MSFFTILGLFFLKHGLLAHVVDFGYSYSRSTCRRFWYLGLFAHCAAELAVSFLLLPHYGWTHLSWVMALELTSLVASSWVERRAPVRRLFSTHLVCEAAVLAIYALGLGWLVNA